MFTRRSMLTVTAAATAWLATAVRGASPAKPAAPSPFVRRAGTGFVLNGKPYRYVGANMWYGAYLGAPGAKGDRARLTRELDRLKAIGVTNLRLLASGEDGPLKHSVHPTFHGKDGPPNADLLTGLDFLLAEMGKRGMTAVLYLTNFWEWSGGMMTYLSWVNDGRYMDAGDPDHPWPAFANATAEFYATPKAVALMQDWVRTVVGRTNSITGKPYKDDPAIMAWQLCNEPRPGGDTATGQRLLSAYLAWAQGTARLIKSLDPNHLVSIGSEGLKGALENAEIYKTLHAMPEFDYLTAHIWPQNWEWVDAQDLAGTSAKGLALATDYVDKHVGFAKELGKPLVIEEFGWPRDGGGYDPVSSTHSKDGYYRMIYTAVEASARSGGPLAGSNFWAWSGAGRAAHGDHEWRVGDPLLGDPPHEPQGWYGVFDGDKTTIALIEEHARALAAG
ncbi:MAG: cellulase family glycosylhydrolase [Sphingobium sp.]|nr:cellulase family glycosylhydrolase [Sphingobium sp.]